MRRSLMKSKYPAGNASLGGGGIVVDRVCDRDRVQAKTKMWSLVTQQRPRESLAKHTQPPLRRGGGGGVMFKERQVFQPLLEYD